MDITIVGDELGPSKVVFLREPRTGLETFVVGRFDDHPMNLPSAPDFIECSAAGFAGLFVVRLFADLAAKLHWEDRKVRHECRNAIETHRTRTGEEKP